MNILIWVHDYAPRVGGAQVYASQLAEGLVQAGHAVRLATGRGAGAENDGQHPFEVVRGPSLLTLWRLIGETDVVQLTGPVLLPLFLALCRGKPTVIEHHGYQAACPNGLLFYEPTKTQCPGHYMAGRYRECLSCNAARQGWLESFRMLLLTFPRRWLSARASVNAPITHHVQERLQLPHSRVIYYGVPEPACPGGQAADGRPRTADSLPPSPPCFAYVGRLVSEKGLPLLIQAAARLRKQGRDVCLKFIGDGPERARLEAMAQSEGLEGRVTFSGLLRGMELENALREVTALVMPSIWEETAGLAAMEQMMRGGVVVAADIGGLGEVVGDAGLKFPARDAGALAACLERLLDQPELARELGHKARARAEKLFRQERMVEEHVGVYTKLAQFV